ncbi:Basic helix-loop-helix DNA-binding superfamily protein, putative isoform 3 [Hibiscus syriacus]|uniref:Basic helix-loop-helix DNA-binding superfamily protein, putative isoform 3 n=1 Tax=Hibiscus syriacus TaxID=106335 RepID=A0A6A2Z5Y7_HIBSY|nr:transcription factor bHLH162-like [Hibiscus syriacus]KAE8686869.1 Basic helix-loop-helix DNA-binding superfamily protein, putative isoform 3 [Hibiscus syriacus]
MEELQTQFLAQTSGLNNKGMGKKRARRSSAKVERKIIEKNRRNQMKNLQSKLYSLIPRRDSKELLSLPEQIDEAVNYIKSLKTRLNEHKEKKEGLIGRKRYYKGANDTNTTAIETTINLKSPELKINEFGSAMEVVLTTGTDSQFMFYDMIYILNQHGAEVLNASFSAVGNTVFHVVHAEVGAFVAAEIIKKKVNKLVHGSGYVDDQLQQELWSFEVHPEMWDLNYEIYPETWDFPIM